MEHCHKATFSSVFLCLGTNRYFRKVAVNNGLTNTLVDATDPKNVEEAIQENTKVGLAFMMWIS